MLELVLYQNSAEDWKKVKHVLEWLKKNNDFTIKSFLLDSKILKDDLDLDIAKS